MIAGPVGLLGVQSRTTRVRSVIAASMTKSAVPAPTRVWRVRQINLDELLP